MKALQLASAPTDVGAEAAPAVPGLPVSTPGGPGSVSEARVLEAAMSLSTLLPAGWYAELGPGSITLSWRAELEPRLRPAGRRRRHPALHRRGRLLRPFDGGPLRVPQGSRSPSCAPGKLRASRPSGR